MSYGGDREWLVEPARRHPVGSATPPVSASLGAPGMATRVAWARAGLLFVLWLAVAGAALAANESAVPKNASEQSALSPYFMTTSQLADPLRPFAHLPKDAAIKVRAAVMTVPDPLETRLGRAFDVELGAVISAFQATGYTLDGFAFTWTPRKPDGDDAYVTPDSKPRGTPSVILFRRDDWRNCNADSRKSNCGSSYFALFIVGETPSSGIHPKAFERAARCAVALDSANRKDSSVFPSYLKDEACDRLATNNAEAMAALNCDRQLTVIGPSFSGSMESMAAALSDAASEAANTSCGGLSPNGTTPGLHIQLLTPSASISNNDDVQYHAYLNAVSTGSFNVTLEYRSLAYSVSDQMDRVMSYLEPRIGPAGSIVVLSEESSFGGGTIDDFRIRRLRRGNAICPGGKLDVKDKCWGHLISLQFPPNIAAIRAEHVKVMQNQDAERRQILPEQLLELDLTGVDKGTDQPPTYQPTLSSRSDELMLYQTLDALKSRLGHPAAVIVVATDVRDRLFLMSEIRSVLPSALPIVLEQDNLLEHPDYRDISRGSITMPAGRSLICLDPSNNSVSCRGMDTVRSAFAGVMEAHPDSDACSSLPRHFAFATDYAANTFRAMVRLSKQQDASTDQEKRAFMAQDERWMDPPMLVATLAGFQYVDDPEIAATPSATCKIVQGKRGPDILIAADTRLPLQEPMYLAMALVFLVMLVVALWLILNHCDQSLLVFPISRLALRWARVDSPAKSPPFNMAPLCWLVVWIAMAMVGLHIAGGRVVMSLWPDARLDNDLVHGRALWALIGLCLAYGCFVVLTMFRMREWNAHCLELSRAVGSNSPLGTRLRRQGGGYAILSALILVVVLCLSVDDRNPASADHAWVSELGGAFALCGSVIFLTLFVEAFDRLCRITMDLDKMIKLIQRGTGLSDWPTPCLLGERPTSPFNITMRLKNYSVWRKYGSGEWAKYTQLLLKGYWRSGAWSGQLFETWQTMLVAEMKFAVMAMRACAWCSVFGATLTMLLIQVYPSAYPRLQTTASVVLLAFGFAAIVYVVLTLEKDRLLGRMFTSDKDGLTFGNALSVLWPKLLALASILVMVFLPGVWGWVGGLIKAVNSLR